MSTVLRPRSVQKINENSTVKLSTIPKKNTPTKKTQALSALSSNIVKQRTSPSNTALNKLSSSFKISPSNFPVTAIATKPSKSMKNKSKYLNLQQALKPSSGKYESVTRKTKPKPEFIVFRDPVPEEAHVSKKLTLDISNQTKSSEKTLPIPSVESQSTPLPKINSKHDSVDKLIEKGRTKSLESIVDLDVSEPKPTMKKHILDLDPLNPIESIRESQNSLEKTVPNVFTIENYDKENFDPEFGMYEREKKKLRIKMTNEGIGSSTVIVNRIPLSEVQKRHRQSSVSEKKEEPKKRVRMPR
ncbi:hypothetical protein HK096_011272 [Nowakowskiella sp. JEL0078]|nr:hypothetical protein HK096_011272 [Nowakowskiella sp. JEL0078]